MTVFHQSSIDRPSLRAYRLERVRQKLRERDLMGILLYDPLNIRYATDSSNMQVWTMHNAVRYAFLPTEGPVILFDFHRCEHLSADIETIDEIRGAKSFIYFSAGDKMREVAGQWADEIADLVTQHGGGNRRLAVDKAEPLAVWALQERQIDIHEGQEVMELAREIKAPIEIAAMKESVTACEEGIRRMHDALRPGMTETELWSILHQTNIEMGGEWIETRLLKSGETSFPWYREADQRVIQDGDIVSFDTDLVGPHGYCTDMSRAWLCGDQKPSDDQRRVFELAREQMRYNSDLLKPGMGFQEYAEKAWQIPDDCYPYRYTVLAHGVGLCDEYPALMHHGENIYDGVFQPGMVMCVESLIGNTDVRECVKLEDQILITETGTEILTNYRYEDHLLGG